VLGLLGRDKGNLATKREHKATELLVGSRATERFDNSCLTKGSDEAMVLALSKFIELGAHRPERVVRCRGPIFETLFERDHGRRKFFRTELRS
jgi:hypothetical protein